MISFLYNGSVGKARCEPGWSWLRSSPMPDYDLWYAIEGKGQMIINEVHYPICKGSCFLIRPGDQVKATQELDHRLTVIFIHFTIQPGLEVELPERHVRIEDTIVPETCLQRIVDLQLREEDRQEEEFDLLVHLVLLHMLRQQKSGVQSPISHMHKQLIHKVIDELRDQTGGKAITVASLAKDVNVSSRYLSQLFMKYTGFSLREYITRVRMERARFLLSETAMNITEVSSALGFTDVYHFSKMFKSHNGAPPSRYRYKGRPAKSDYGDFNHSQNTDPLE